MSQKTDALLFHGLGLRLEPISGEAYTGVVNIGSGDAVVTLTCYRGDASIPVTIPEGESIYAPITTWAVTSGTVAGIPSGEQRAVVHVPPIPLPAATLHLDAALGLTIVDTDKVDSWADQSGNGHDVSAPAGINRPTLISNAINSLPVVRGDGVNGVLRNLDLFLGTLDTSCTVFIVAEALACTDTHRFYFIAASDDTQIEVSHLWQTLASCKHATGRSGIGSLDSTIDAVDGNFRVIQNNQIGSTTMDMHVDSQLVGSVGTTSLANPQGVFAMFALLWHTGSLAQYGNCDIAEIMVYDGELTVGEQTQVTDHLHTKFAIPKRTMAWPDSDQSFWYRSTNVETTGANVDTVTNLGTLGTAGDLSAAGTLPLVAGSINGLPAIQHSNGATDYFTSSGNVGITGSQARTIFVVAQDEMTVDSIMLGWGADVTGQRFDFWTNLSSGMRVSTSSGERVGTNTPKAWKIYCIRLVTGFTTARGIQMWKNGVWEVLSHADTAINTSVATLRVGTNNPNDGRNFNGLWAEIRIYDADVDDARSKTIHEELSARYNIPLIMTPLPVRQTRDIYIASTYSNSGIWYPVYGPDGSNPTGDPTTIFDTDINQNVMALDGTSDNFDLPNLNGLLGPTDNISVFSAFNHLARSGGFWGAIVAQGRGNNSEDVILFATASSNDNTYALHGGQTMNLLSTSLPSGWMYATAIFDNTVSKTLYKNGTLLQQLTTGLTYTTSGVTAIRLGKTSNADSEATARLAVIVICLKVVDEETRLAIEAWIQNYTQI